MTHKLSISILSALMLSSSIAFAQTAREAANQQALNVLMSDFEQAQRALNRTPGEILPGSDYLIKAEDRLETIAMQSYGHTALNQEIVQKIILEKNPNAFFRGNGDYPMVGETVVIPTIDDIRSYVFSYRKGNKYPHTPQTEWIRFP